MTDAKVTVQNLGTGLQRDAQTGVSGAFTFTALPVGKYQLTVEKEGFSKYVQSGITLVLDQTANVPVQLNVGNLSQEVTVSADAEVLNTQSGTVGQLIDQRRIVICLSMGGNRRICFSSPREPLMRQATTVS